MSKIVCPNCKKEFDISGEDYESIVKIIKNQEFKKELEERKEQIKRQSDMEYQLSQKRAEEGYNKALNEKEKQILELQAKVSKAEEEKSFSVTKALAEQQRTIVELEAKLSAKDTEKELALSKVVQEKDKELVDREKTINTLKNAIENNKNNYQIQAQNLKDTYENKLKDKEEQLNYYKDLKTRMSTKMVGETLEQHCEIQFNSIRATAFKNAYFEKDNDAHTGSKGDYIFRDFADDKTPIISIMFEMKNETDSASKKHKNEEFFKELDKDRKEKGCEYAVLVSLLEPDNELYNGGIVDVSYKYEKMYVIRPQFFIPIITLLRNAALNSLEYKKQLMVVKEQNLDISRFEDDMNDFKTKFGRDCKLAVDRFETAIAEIDKTIEHLQKTKDSLMSSENHLRLANNKVEDLSIKKLTKNNPTMAEKFKEEKDKKNITIK